jgi:hypothetical protein
MEERGQSAAGGGNSHSVCRVFIFKVTKSSPLRDSPACAKRAAYPDPPPVVPHPESLADQAACTEALLPRSGSGPNCHGDALVLLCIVYEYRRECCIGCPGLPQGGLQRPMRLDPRACSRVQYLNVATVFESSPAEPARRVAQQRMWSPPYQESG